MIIKANHIIIKAVHLAVFNGIIFGVSSCDGKRSSNKPPMNSTVMGQPFPEKLEIEDFNKFIEVFFKKRDFQLGRIAFPVSNLIYDTDSEKFDSTSIKKEDWKYWNIYKQKNVVLKTMRMKPSLMLRLRKQVSALITYLAQQRVSGILSKS